MTVKLLKEHYFEFLGLKGGCTGSSESTLVKMPHCWNYYVMAQLYSWSITHYNSQHGHLDTRSKSQCNSWLLLKHCSASTCICQIVFINKMPSYLSVTSVLPRPRSRENIAEISAKSRLKHSCCKFCRCQNLLNSQSKLSVLCCEICIF